MSPANSNRINRWSEILSRFGDVDSRNSPRIFIHKRCARLLDCIPAMQHDPNRPEDVLRIDADQETGVGDDTRYALRPSWR